MMSSKLSRRHFLKYAGISSAMALWGLASCAPQPQPTATPPPPTVAPTKPAPTATPVPTATPIPTATPKPAGPKVLRIRLLHDIRTLDPAFEYSDQETFPASAIFNGLVTYREDTYEVVNDLAETIESSADGTVISFKLREGVKWHQGYGEVTTEDVKFSYERYRQVDSPYKDDWAALDHVEIIDKYRGKIILKEPFAPLWHSTLPVDRGWILCKKYVEEVGNEKFATNPIGSGPYYFAEWKPQEKLILKRNPDYFGPPAPFDEIQFFPIEDDKTAEVALEAGEIDMCYHISLGSVERFKSNPRFKVISRPALSYAWIGMNIEHPKLQDINVRQAIRYGIDVPSIIKAAYMGQVEPCYCLIAPGLLGHWKDAPRYERDVAKAKEFLAKAGVQTLDLRIDVPDTSEYRPWGEIAQQNLKEIGINLSVNPIDMTSFWSIGEGEKGKELELFASNYTMYPDPAWATMWFTCDQIGVWNWMRWCSQEFDELHKKGLVTLDNAERERIYIKMQQLWDEACHTIWITHSAFVVAYVPTIVPVLSPHGLMRPRWMKPA